MMEITYSPLVGFLTLFKKECARFMKVAGQTIASPLINSSLYLLIFGINLADSISVQNGVNYLQFIIPGLMAMGILNNAFQNSASSIITSKFHGDLQDLKVVPLSSNQILWAYALAATARGLIVGTAIMLLGEVFYFSQYGSLMPIYSVGLLLVFVFFGGITFAFMGLSVAIFAKNFEQVNVIGTFVLLPLLYLGGVFFSINNLHPLWKAISYMNPLFYLINGVRYSAIGVGDITPGFSFIVTIIFVAVTYGIANVAVRKGNYQNF